MFNVGSGYDPAYGILDTLSAYGLVQSMFVMGWLADQNPGLVQAIASYGHPVGTHGYCMSGPYSLAAAARYPDRIAAAASFYGTWLVSDAVESPHLTLGKAKGELYISCAEHDELAPPEMVKELKALFDKSGAKGELEVHPTVHHGFAFPQRWCYDKPAAERHWERLIALYRRNLG